MPENFQFLQPQWFYLLLPLVILIGALLRQGSSNKDAWQKVVDQKLLTWLRVSKSTGRTQLPVWLLSVSWVIAVLALANPVWEKLATPVFQTDMARVIVLDLSRSMNSSDLKPSRIERARFKVSDILKQQQEGVIGLVVFAGDAFTVSPLTRDADTISAMLPALKPGIMPVQGSRADLALLKAAELLQQAGHVRGEILLLADSYTDKRTIKAAKKLREQGYLTSVLGIGTEQGAPLPTGKGGFFRRDDGQVIVTRLDKPAMQKLADAGGGSYVNLSSGNVDIKSLMESRTRGSRSSADNDTFETSRWKETGPLFVLLLLPFAALAFRRGWLLSVSLLVLLTMPNEQALAFSLTDLWQRQDQQSHKALLAGELDVAAELARDPVRKGVAEFRKGEYESAVDDFSSSTSTDAIYNKGNALAKLGKLQEAIDAYDQALKSEPDMEDAKFNKEAVEKRLQQQKQSQKQDQQSKQDNKEKQGDQENNDQQGEKGQQGEQSESAKGGKDQQQVEDSSGSQKKDKNDFADAAEQAKKDAESRSDEDTEQEDMTAKQKEDEGEKRDSEAQQAKSEQTDSDEQQENSRTVTDVEELSSEEQIAAEQWLRRIPDDPAGLLRRKLRYQYVQRGGNGGKPADPQPW